MIFDDLLIEAENAGLTVNDPNIHTARARLYRGKRRALPYPHVVVAHDGYTNWRAVLVTADTPISASIAAPAVRQIVEWAVNVLPDPEDGR